VPFGPLRLPLFLFGLLLPVSLFLLELVGGLAALPA
jgi:hypothetical protein